MDFQRFAVTDFTAFRFDVPHIAEEFGPFNARIHVADGRSLHLGAHSDRISTVGPKPNCCSLLFLPFESWAPRLTNADLCSFRDTSAFCLRKAAGAYVGLLPSTMLGEENSSEPDI